jgi:hypothetical protein
MRNPQEHGSNEEAEAAVTEEHRAAGADVSDAVGA